jgi:hypothetical protein
MELGIMRITRRQLRRIIREAMVTTGTPYSSSPDTHNMSANRAAELMAVLQEFGYSLFIGPSVDSNTYAIRDALAAYPGEFTEDELLTAISITQGRGA